jgi:hypothetical protein
MKKCSVEGCNNNVWSSDKCVQHIPKKPLRTCRGSLQAHKAKVDIDTTLMRNFFVRLWNKRRRVSEISGEKLLSPVSSLYFHHILPKSKYKEAMYDEENLILLTPIEHGNVENNPQRYEIINNKRDYLLKKYSNFDE